MEQLQGIGDVLVFQRERVAVLPQDRRSVAMAEPLLGM